ncbi:hypothetical protein O0I10_012972 [Lichtheimia ornata]|uniref:Secreted protein n=1 Tax=Lichtheimia ornata TaxID=688661 RepID=A0AAD7XSL8_9FUNG|nr:uncharacterized protein O0I10_012972 [Lichtheimia ornata]KAJ8651473.1 hypothetical protein O0I10_012972 [Lichtheimia ornata]
MPSHSYVLLVAIFRPICLLASSSPRLPLRYHQVTGTILRNPLLGPNFSTALSAFLCPIPPEHAGKTLKQWISSRLFSDLAGVVQHKGVA